MIYDKNYQGTAQPNFLGEYFWEKHSQELWNWWWGCQTLEAGVSSCCGVPWFLTSRPVLLPCSIGTETLSVYLQTIYCQIVSIPLIYQLIVDIFYYRTPWWSPPPPELPAQWCPGLCWSWSRGREYRQSSGRLLSHWKGKYFAISVQRVRLRLTGTFLGTGPESPAFLFCWHSSVLRPPGLTLQTAPSDYPHQPHLPSGAWGKKRPGSLHCWVTI